MGTGFVLLAWLAVGGVLALVSSLVAAGVVRWLTRRTPEVRSRATVVAVAFPFGTLAFFAAGFITYAFICEFVRGVDPGIGDLWRVPLGHGYALVMIDTPEQAFIAVPGPGQHDLPLSSIGGSRSFLAVTSTSEPPYFILDLSKGTLTSFPDQRTFRRAAEGHGISPAAIQSPERLYHQLRWSAFDALFGLFILAVPATVAVLLIARLLRSTRGGRA